MKHLPGHRPPPRSSSLTAIRLALPIRVLVVVLCIAATIVAVPARAGHEMPFYPSYYPQEITVESMPAAVAAARLEKNTVHAFVGGDPFAGRALPAKLRGVDSLGSYVVVTMSPTTAALATAQARCTAARAIIAGLHGEGWRPHPYPVTPYHPDHLAHVDLIEAAQNAPPPAPGTRPASRLRVRSRGALAERLLGGLRGPGAWDALVEEVSVRDLVGASTATLNGGSAPPWIKDGWFHAWLLNPIPSAHDLAQRLMAGEGEGAAERLNLERALVSRVRGGCERVVAGYTVRREVLNADYSAGVENVAADSLTGFDAPVFLRTVKLKDFPWNGWLTIGVPERATAAWNPIAGFTDPTGRLLWAGLSDGALFSEPRAGRFVENRVRLETPQTGALAVPADAIVPEPGTGKLRQVGAGKTARAKLTYRVLSSTYHDGSRMTATDALYGLSFAFRWGAGRGHEDDAEIRRATALMRDWLVGVRVVRVETDVLRFGDVTMKYDVPIVEIYLAHTLSDSTRLAAVSPPWTPLPWPVVALLEEAVTRGVGAFSAEAAKRRGVPWLDIVRNAKTRDRLLALLGELEREPFVPVALTGRVTPAEARERWARLQQFAADHHHVLVTSGPYLLHAWSPGGAVLRVFRDFSYPLGVGSFDRYAVPLHGAVVRADVRPDRIEIQAEAERVERFGREHRLVNEPVGSPAVQKDRGAVVVCRYVIVGPEGAVVRAGVTDATSSGLFVIGREGVPAGAHAHVQIVVNGTEAPTETRTVALP